MSSIERQSKAAPIITVGTIFGPLAFGFLMFMSGVEGFQHHWSNMTMHLLIGTAIALYVVLMVRDRLNERVREAIIAEREFYTNEAKAKLDGIFDQAKHHLDKVIASAEELLAKPTDTCGKDELTSTDRQDIELAMAIAKDVLKGEHRNLTADEVLVVQNEFHDQSDGRYLQIHTSSDAGIEMEISDTPFPESPWNDKPGRTLRHAAAAERGDKARAAQTPAKPLTKAQQKRANAKAGLGAFTDDEIREQKNAARRAARAARKAAASTVTSTTTLDGQTDLGV